VVVQVQQISSILSHHPVCAASDASRLFLIAQPPLWPGGAIRPNTSQQFAKEVLTQKFIDSDSAKGCSKSAIGNGSSLNEEKARYAAFLTSD
jgi:hypothetical protein